MRWVVGAILFGSALAVGCSRACPRPSIVGVPPDGSERLELSLPLDAASQAALEAYLRECGAAGGAICENPLSPGHACALQTLQSGPPAGSKAAAKALAACSGTPEFSLEIRDARVRAEEDLRGAVVDGFVFVVRPADPLATPATAPRLSVFADYVPVATP